MNNQTTSIIAGSQAVVRCLNEKTIKALGSHSTFTIEELLEKINEASNSVMSLGKVNSIFHKVLNVGNYGFPDLLKEVNDIFSCGRKYLSTEKAQTIFSEIRTNSEYSHMDFLKEFSGEATMNYFIEGVTVSLLEPDGKGWQKGRLKICFEFIPEKDKSVNTEETSATTQDSSLDEIRQLSNSLPIDQN
jgi:KGK domain